MPDQRERLGNQEEALKAMLRGWQAELWTCLPGIVQSFNAAKMTCEVQLAIKMNVRDKNGNWSWKTIASLLDCPVVFPGAGHFIMTWPLQAGDEVLVVFASRCIDSWWQSGGVQVQYENRMHDLSDGFVLPGIKSVPNVPGSISTTTVQLRTLDGSAYIELTAGGAVNIVAPGGVNVTGAIVATDEITAKSSHTVSEHVHGGVQSGGSDTDTPTG